MAVRSGQSLCGRASTFENHAWVPCGENISSRSGLRNGRNPKRDRRAFTGAPQRRTILLENRKNRRVKPGPSENSDVRNGAPENAGGSWAERKTIGCRTI